MRPRYRIRSRDEERYLEAVGEARQNVRPGRRDYHDALDQLEELEHIGPEGPESTDPRDEEFYRPRRRGRPR